MVKHSEVFKLSEITPGKITPEVRHRVANSYLFELQGILKLYNQHLKNLFYISVEEIDAYREEREKEYQATNKYNDLEKIRIKALDDSFERYWIYDNMDYRCKALILECLCQVWEQQLFELANFNSYSVYYKDTYIPLSFSNIKVQLDKNHKDVTVMFHSQNDDNFNHYDSVRSFYFLIGIDFTTFDSYSKVSELRDVVNSLKHGHGYSLNKLKKEFPHLVSGPGVVWPGIMSTTMLNEHLNITDELIAEYGNSLICFWNEFVFHVDQINQLNES